MFVAIYMYKYNAMGLRELLEGYIKKWNAMTNR